MSINTAIYSALTSDPTVSNLIADRVYPSYDRQTDRIYPLAVYRIDVAPGDAFDGPSGLSSGILEIAAIASTFREADQIADAVYNALPQLGGTFDGVIIQGIFLQDDGRRPDVVTDPSTEEILFHVQSLRFDLRWTT